VTPITATDDNGNSSIVGGVVEPSNFETREVGVILSVVPRLSPEGSMIELTMTPEVVAEPTWYEYGSVYTAPDGSEQRLNMQQPFFHTRSISTTIAIYNGATVMMGGMITEIRDEVDDKIPVLGDIPIVGRLFQSRYERSEKRNLLIFVTARLVDPAGRHTSVAQDSELGRELTGSVN
jgi:general secretion pathway protein D